MTAASKLAGSLTTNTSVAVDKTDTSQGSNSDSETTTVKPVEPEVSSDILLPLILKLSG